MTEDPYGDAVASCNNNVGPWTPAQFVYRNILAGPFAKVTQQPAITSSWTESQCQDMDETSNGVYPESEEYDEGEGEAKSVATPDTSVASFDERPFPLMKLPYEIRCQVYHWVHLMHPVRNPQLTPWYPMPAYSTYFLKAIFPDQAFQEVWKESLATFEKEHIQNNSRPIKGPRLLSPYRPYARMPDGLLAADKQSYNEVREIPFVHNEFVFVNWFASGLWAARSFMKALRPWQRDAMRYARLEVLSRDLGGLYKEEWQELCEFWGHGLQGLRLKILVGGGSFGSWLVDSNPEKGGTLVPVLRDDGKPIEWISKGLALMKNLKFLEVELQVADTDIANKLQWCGALQDCLNGSRTVDGRELVRVLCVEKECEP